MQENLNTAQLEQTGENTAGPAAGGENEAERRERYDRLIKEEFKDLYTGDTQKLINRRFKELHELREKVRLQEQELEALRRQAAPPAPDYSGQIEEMKAERPDFDFEKEMERPDFAALIEKGAPLAAAWKVSHHEELIAQAASSAGLEAERKIAANIACRGSRPRENAASGGGVRDRRDVSSLTREDRAEAARRALKGESVHF